jgi:glucose/mannose-6-phosphate isomerase
MGDYIAARTKTERLILKSRMAKHISPSPKAAPRPKLNKKATVPKSQKSTVGLLNERTIARLDASDMRTLIQELYKQFYDHNFEVVNSHVTIDASIVQNIVITGMGGSALGGDLVRSYLQDELRLPVVVSRNYTLPTFVNEHTLVIAASYSGNTEETLASYHEAVRKKTQVYCITSGGELEQIALEHGHFLVKVPTGYVSRAAVGLSFVPMVEGLMRFGLVESKMPDIYETIAYLKDNSSRYTDYSDKNNLAVQIAKKSYQRLPIIYTNTERTDVVGTRWRSQFCENAKILAYHSVLPEMNYNELVGWKAYKDILQNTHVIFLRDRDDHARTQFRMNLTKRVAAEHASHISEVYTEGNSLMTRIFSLMLLGDWTSYYLAILNGIDPSPVDVIEDLKDELRSFE